MSRSSTNLDSNSSTEKPPVHSLEAISAESYRKIAEFTRIGREAVRKAQEENRRLGVPNVYSINGILHWELPSGELTTEDPYPAMQAAKEREAGK